MKSLPVLCLSFHWARALSGALLLVAALQLAACATPPSPPPSEPKPLAQDTARLTDGLLGQWRRESALRAAFTRALPRGLMLAPPADLVSPVPAGQPVPAQVLQNLSAQGLIDLAQAAYDAGDHAQALDLFTRAAQQPGGRQLRVFNGQYLAQMKLGQPVQAQQVFAGLVDLGLQSRALALKFLFRPNSTDFWPDPAVSGPYGGWIAEIALQSAASGLCLDVRGHSSRSGGLDYNLQLSLQRAQRIRDRLVQVQPPLAERLQTTGLGWSENIVGTGSDDASDALDQRVEFRVLPCA